MDPVTGAHTQGIERCWKSWKDYVRRSRCVRDDRISEYLYAWVFVFNRTQSGVPRNQIINDILSCFVWNVSKFPEVSILWRDGSMKCFLKYWQFLKKWHIERWTFQHMHLYQSFSLLSSTYHSNPEIILEIPLENRCFTTVITRYYRVITVVIPWLCHDHTIALI